MAMRWFWERLDLSKRRNSAELIDEGGRANNVQADPGDFWCKLSHRSTTKLQYHTLGLNFVSFLMFSLRCHFEIVRQLLMLGKIKFKGRSVRRKDFAKPLTDASRLKCVAKGPSRTLPSTNAAMNLVNANQQSSSSAISQRR